MNTSLLIDVEVIEAKKLRFEILQFIITEGQQNPANSALAAPTPLLQKKDLGNASKRIILACSGNKLRYSSGID